MGVNLSRQSVGLNDVDESRIRASLIRSSPQASMHPLPDAGSREAERRPAPGADLLGELHRKQAGLPFVFPAADSHPRHLAQEGAMIRI